MSWLSIDTWLVTLLSVSFLLAMFFIAYWGDRSQANWLKSSWLYSLSLGVSCSSWAFYGIIGQASVTGYWLSPIYFGTIAFFVLGWPVLLKLLRVSKQQKFSSIADFIASRYERHRSLAVGVIIITLLGLLPYIALQLRAISQTFDLVTGSYRSGFSTSLMVSLVLIVFAILFGARTQQVNKQNKGMVLAIAMGSLVKLIALSAVGIFVTFGLFNGVEDILRQSESLSIAKSDNSAFAAQMLLGAVTIFITPPLYHMIVIENQNERQLQKARWQYPLYLLLINAFVLPIALAGKLTFPGGAVNADTFALTLPLFHQQAWLSLLVFIGGLTAAISITIVIAVVLSNMIVTDIITPALVRLRMTVPTTTRQHTNGVFAKQLLTFRRTTIAVVLLLAFSFEQFVAQDSHLANLGTLSFALLAQFAPAVIAALYWSRANSTGAAVGIIVGATLWGYCLLLPTLAPNALILQQGLWGLDWLNPTALFGFTGFTVTTHGIFISLLMNSVSLVLFSWLRRPTIGERLQARLFVKTHSGHHHYCITVTDLGNLLRRFVDEAASDRFRQRHENELNSNSLAPESLIKEVQDELSSVLGSVSTKLIMRAATEQDSADLAIDQVADIVSEATELFAFNRELLQAAVQNIEQGISVVDADMRLVAWNKRYVELLEYPDGFLQAGMPIATVIAFNVERGMMSGDQEREVSRRIQHMQAGKNHHFLRTLPNHRVIEIRGQAMPKGGFVSTFSDITQHIETERQLQQANQNLELRVQERTQELSLAKAEAEAANRSKTRFLAAASHDLMQPFNALSLFTDMLQQRAEDTNLATLAEQIKSSLSSAEAILSDLVEIAKLESASLPAELSHFCLDDIFVPLVNEMHVIALQHNVALSYVKTSVWVYSDKKLLRRVMQNLLNNAVIYSAKRANARVVVGVRRSKDQLIIQVLDNGPGIPQDKQALIFNEFERLPENQSTPGLGLGLAICQRIANLLKIKLGVSSVFGRGSCFYAVVARSQDGQFEGLSAKTMSNGASATLSSTTSIKPQLDGLRVLIIDNDAQSLSALEQLLQSWQCAVTAISGLTMYASLDSRQEPHLIIADYHLDNGEDGISTAQQILRNFADRIPCIIYSADASETLRQLCIDNDFSYLQKPVKHIALKRLLKQLTSLQALLRIAN